MKFERGDYVRYPGSDQVGRVMNVYSRATSDGHGFEQYKMIINFGPGWTTTVTGVAQMQQILLVRESSMKSGAK